MAEMDEVPVGHASVDSRVLAHWRDDDTVGQLEGTDAKRCKQRAHANFSIFSVEPVGRCRPIFLTPRCSTSNLEHICGPTVFQLPARNVGSGLALRSRYQTLARL